MSLEIERTGPVIDGELVEDPKPVDRPEREHTSAVRIALARQAADRRAIVPAWARDRSELGFVLRWLAAHLGHVGAFHAVRLPIYALVLALRFPAGAAKTLGAAGRWAFDAEAHPLRVGAVRSGDTELYLRLARERQGRVRGRLIVVGLAALALLASWFVLAYVAAVWVAWLVVSVLVAVLGWVGAPADRPIVGASVVVAQVQRLTSEIVERALGSIGIAAMTSKGARITFPSPITRDGPGWRAEVDLPLGVTATDVIEKRDRLAAGLRRPLGCCWPEPVSEAHPGRLVLWVGDVDMAKAKPAAWPLRKARKASIFSPAPFGTDQRGRPVGLDLMYSNMLIGALPGAGKTFALRVIVLDAAMDPTVELRVFELKGSGDLDAVEPIAHHYASGADDETMSVCVASLREVYAELETRAATIKRLAKAGRCPENKVTPTLAADRSLGLWPLLLVVDECQELYSHSEYGKEAAALSTAIIKRGRALGIMLVLVTQRPDKDSLPKSISDNVGVRFCLRVMGQPANDMILGTSAYQQGIRATMLRPSDKGVGYLVGAADEPQIVRGYYIDGDAAKTAVQNARLLREQAGTLTGVAAGEAQIVVNVADDVLAVFGDESKLWTAEILRRLAHLRPEVYGAWEPSQLAAALRPFGASPQQVWGADEDGKGTNRQGYAVETITRAIRP